jgi:general secretion pathway protein A
MVTYREHFGLAEPPFSIAPDPRYLYMSEQHREALAHLHYGIQSDGGFVLLTGEVGTGKTTISRCLLDQLPEDCVVAFIINPRLTVPELLSTICDELRIPYPEGNRSVKIFIDLINGFLLDAHAGGRRAVLIIDEAQHLEKEVLEQIRLLTNLETNTRKLLQIILLGQPELREKMAQPELRQLSQRIIARYHLGPLGRQETAVYVNHRLTTAGSRRQLFAPQALGEIYRQSGGIPRLVNLICDRALLGAYAQGKGRVDRATVARAAREVLGEATGRANRGRVLTWHWIGTAVLAVCVVSVAATYYGSSLQYMAVKLPALVHNGRALDFRQRRPIPKATTRTEEETVSQTGVRDDAPVPGTEPTPAEAAASIQEPIAHPSTGKEDTSEPDGQAISEVALGKLEELARSQDRESACRTLLGLWGGDFQPQKGSVCHQAEMQGLRCFSGQGGLDELKKWNRPVVLKLRDVKGNEPYALLITLRGKTATFKFGDENVTVPVDEALSGWSGEFILLRPAPPRFSGNLRSGDKGQAVAWLKSRLASVRGEVTELGADAVFDEKLRERVKEFQLANGLDSDGIVGSETLTLLVLEANTVAPVLEEGKKGP